MRLSECGIDTQTEWPTHASMRLSECVLIHRLNGQLMPPHNRLSESGIVTSDWMANSCLRLNDQLMPQTQWPTHASGLMANSCLWLNGQLMPPWGCLNVVWIHQSDRMANLCLHKTGCLNMLIGTPDWVASWCLREAGCLNLALLHQTE